MHLTHLSLADFRSYAQVDVALDPGVTAFVGPNGQGKTNLVEAVGYLATLGSHRVSSDAPLVRMGAERAVVRAAVRQGERRQLVELELNPGKANRARINRSSQVKPRDVLGIVRTVLFAPEDLALIKGDPGERRRFLDELITARTPRMAGVRSDYERVLKQRNTLLKSAALARRHGGRSMDLSTLDVWDQHLARAGAELLAQRLSLIAALQPLADKAYEQLAPGGGPVTLEYKPSAPGGAETRDDLFEQLMGALGGARKQEIERGVTLVGPHRDDLLIRLGRLPAKGYASHGESWSCALALRLASYDLLRAEDPWAPQHGPTPSAPPQEAAADASSTASTAPSAEGRRPGEPVLVLDDVFAELDARRRERLAELVAPGEQVLVTAAVDDDVPAVLTGRRYAVADGTVERI
ncbi:DNA replication and repair protein RecF [Streptomyces sulfonofaciens]|uniref:DNA replication and repair protein RecF n=1 Tax=Streptomyces sulfonofaciens TaxID=68272 RepID=A0A919KSD0_9ACTN|nr:DNA replication/repair protein RecF [Streptomyces sulfonofaciens]GHH70286.1 DNA replication and repair protein RecF [Streptomyces sulfonofaciens]